MTLHSTEPKPVNTFPYLSNLWEERMKFLGSEEKATELELKTVRRKVDQLLDRILETEDSSTIKIYETKMRKLEEKKLLLEEKV